MLNMKLPVFIPYLVIWHSQVLQSLTFTQFLLLPVCIMSSVLSCLAVAAVALQLQHSIFVCCHHLNHREIAV